MAPGSVNRAVEIQDETIHPKLLELTMEIIKNHRKMEEEQQQGIDFSALEHVDVMEKVSSVVDKESSVVEKNPSVVEKAQDVEIGAGLDDEEMEEVGKQSGVDSGAEEAQENDCPPPPDGEFQDAEEMVESIKKFALDHGYAICIRQTEKEKGKIFKCDQYELLFLFFSIFFLNFSLFSLHFFFIYFS